MGRALIVVIAVAAGRSAAADAPEVSVSGSCDAIIDRATVTVALRVELEHGGADTVFVDCPAGDDVVVALGDRRTSVALSDVARPARARVVALAVAEQLRPASTPATAEVTVEPGEPPRPRDLRRWTLALRVDGVAAKEANVGLATAVVARRWGRFQLEGAVGGLAGGGNGARVLGLAAEGWVAVTALRFGRTNVDVAGGLLYAATWTKTDTASQRENAAAARGELRSEFDLGATGWRGVVAIGGGRALAKSSWFGSITLGAVVGL